MVDEKKVSFNPAVELSYLSTEQQQEMINIWTIRNAPSFSSKAHKSWHRMTISHQKP